MPPHPQGECLQPDHEVLRGEEVERGATVAADPGSHRLTGGWRRKDPGKGRGARPAGQDSTKCFIHTRLPQLSSLPLLLLLLLLSRLQICANLDSAIVSTKNYVPELNNKVPRPIKTFDIVDQRPKVCTMLTHRLHSYSSGLPHKFAYILCIKS